MIVDSKNKKSKKTYGVLYVLSIIYLIIDYGRPQYIFPFIGVIRPALITTVLLFFYLLKNGLLFRFEERQIKLMWYFIVLLTAYIPFATNNYYAYNTALSQFLYMPFIISLTFCINNLSTLKKFINIFIFLMIYVAIFSLLNRGRGPGNYFLDENDLSLFINTWLPFCYFLYSSEMELKSKILYMGGFVIGISAVVVSFSRGGFVGLLTVTFFIWWNSKTKVYAFVLFLLACIILAYNVDEIYWTEMETVTDITENTASERLRSWGAAWRMFIDNPLGVGGNNFQVRFPEYQGDNFERGMWGRVAHSLWFTLIPELGVVGIYLYIALLIENLKQIFWLKNQKNESREKQYARSLGLAFLTSFAGFFASATFLSVLYYAHYWYLTGLIVAAVKIIKRSEVQDVYSKEPV